MQSTVVKYIKYRIRTYRKLKSLQPKKHRHPITRLGKFLRRNTEQILYGFIGTILTATGVSLISLSFLNIEQNGGLLFPGAISLGVGSCFFGSMLR